MFHRHTFSSLQFLHKMSSSPSPPKITDRLFDWKAVTHFGIGGRGVSVCVCVCGGGGEGGRRGPEIKD